MESPWEDAVVCWKSIWKINMSWAAIEWSPLSEEKPKLTKAHSAVLCKTSKQSALPDIKVKRPQLKAGSQILQKIIGDNLPSLEALAVSWLRIWRVGNHRGTESTQNKFLLEDVLMNWMRKVSTEDAKVVFWEERSSCFQNTFYWLQPFWRGFRFLVKQVK